MTTREDVLRLADELAATGAPLTVLELIRHYGLSPAAAAGHIMRAWRAGLIAPRGSRPRGYRARLRPGERLSELRFELTRRGHQRLELGTPIDDLFDD